MRTVRAGVPYDGRPSLLFCVAISTWSPASTFGTVICTLKVPPDWAEDGEAVPITGPVMLSMRSSAGEVRESDESCGEKPLALTVMMSPGAAEAALVLRVANPVQAYARLAADSGTASSPIASETQTRFPM